METDPDNSDANERELCWTEPLARGSITAWRLPGGLWVAEEMGESNAQPIGEIIRWLAKEKDNRSLTPADGKCGWIATVGVTLLQFRSACDRGDDINIAVFCLSSLE